MSRILAITVWFFRPRGVAAILGLALALVLGGVTTTGLAQGTKVATRDGPGQPVAVWPPGPLEVVATFDQPLDPSAAKAMVGRSIPYGELGGDPANPPGQTGTLRIVGAELVDDGRTLVLATDPHPRAARYVLPLAPVLRSPATSGQSAPAATAYDLSGVEATWSDGDVPGGDPKWSGWWPSLDLDATRRRTHGSRPHETGLALLSRSGYLVLSCWVRLPPGKATWRVESSAPIEEATLGDVQATGATPQADGTFRISPVVDSRGEPLFFTMTLRTGNPGKPLSIAASYRLAGEPAGHPVDSNRLLLPWAPTSATNATPAPLTVPDLSGGDPARGRTIFRGDQARCAQCHLFRGEGGRVGPDLTDIARTGRAEIYRSIAAPSATVAPDYTTYTVATRDGQVLSGVVRAEGPADIRVTDINAKSNMVKRDQIQAVRPSDTSTMPPGLVAALGDSGIRDLIAYLTSPPPPENRPPP